jgi:hypothetical protein
MDPEKTLWEELFARLDRMEGKIDKTNGRVSALENWRNFLFGAWTLLVLALGAYFEWRD